MTPSPETSLHKTGQRKGGVIENHERTSFDDMAGGLIFEPREMNNEQVRVYQTFNKAMIASGPDGAQHLSRIRLNTSQHGSEGLKESSHDVLE